eukprot:TRINITY_DN41225_c0_g1_i2.p1 TRINITY_DN41225_c0_g1~~TRINITY_DN41225_c0_g1_i2.p1  ORF type:complete len:467 (+),score=23.22 TRINITY_DN41225_c0_g1_i2:58-1458(+)
MRLKYLACNVCFTFSSLALGDFVDSWSWGSLDRSPTPSADRDEKGCGDARMFKCCEYGGTSSKNIEDSCSNLMEELQQLLNGAVQKSNGYGGGVVRIESSEFGVLWEGSRGHVATLRGCECSESEELHFTSYHHCKCKHTPPRMNPRTAFEIASITKIVTSVTMLRLVMRNLVDLYSPISRYLPEELTRDLVTTIGGNNLSSKLRVWHLLSHRGGISDFWDNWRFIRMFNKDPSKFWTPEETVGYAQSVHGHFHPQTSINGQFHYTDTGFVLAALIIERVTGMSLHRAFSAIVFNPLQMKSTYMSYREQKRTVSEQNDREAHRYEGTVNIYNKTRQSADWGSGGLISDTTDLSRLIRGVFEDESFLDSAYLRAIINMGSTHDYFTSTFATDYSLGFMRIQMPNQLGGIWGHEGHCSSFAFYWPETKLTIVGSLNQLNNDWLKLTADLMQVINRFLPKTSSKNALIY